MMLVEVILGKKTGDKALAVALDYVARDQEDADRGQRHARLLRQPLRACATSPKPTTMLIEGVPAAMIENAAQDGRHAGRPAGAHRRGGDRPRAEDHEADRRAISARRRSTPSTCQLIDTLVDEHGRLGRKNGKGFYDYPAEAGEEEAVAGPEGPLSAEEAPRTSTMKVLKQRLPVDDRARSGARHGGRHRHRSARGRCRLDPRLRLRALHGRRALLHRRHGREGLRRRCARSLPRTMATTSSRRRS